MPDTPLAPPIVNIGIPAIGGARLPYLLEAIDSVLAQTLDEWRLLISEDGIGSEKFRLALQTYTDDPRVAHRVIGERSGIGRNFTTVIRDGDAPYVAILNDDDRWAPEYLARRVAFLDEHVECGLVFSAATIIDEQGAVVGRTKHRLAAGCHPSRDVLPRLFRENFIPAPSVLVRRSAYEHVGATYSDRIFSDHEMWLRLAVHFDFGCLPTWDAHYRMHQTQTVSRRRIELGRHRLELLEAVEDIPVPQSVRREAYADAYVGCALDAVEAADRRGAFRYLRAAVRTRSPALAHPGLLARLTLVVASSVLGSVGRRMLTRARLRRWQTSGAARRSGGLAG